jgi:putative DNA primase/helicase
MAKRSKKRATISSVEFLKKGVFIVYDNGRKQLIGDPINVLALGTGIQDNIAYTVIEFRDRNRKWQRVAVKSAMLTASTNEFIAELTNRNYRWPARKFVSLVIDALAAENPERRIAITMVPGWQAGRYCHPRKLIKNHGDNFECLFADSPNVRLGEFLVCGALEEWETEVAPHCSLSSRLRLAIGTPFAAVILRRLDLGSFGFHFFGDTSSGKTLCLRVACSVPGFNSDAGPTSWDGTLTGIEQHMLGTRDNVTPLDETDVIEGDAKTKAEFVKLTVFKFSKHQQRLRAGHYSRSHGIQSDTRNIIISSGEDILIEPRRVRGQDVRMIHVPACISDFDDIFDADDAADTVGTTVQERETFVTKLATSTRKFQGRALLEFVFWLVDDDKADKILKSYLEEFIKNAPLPESRRVFARLRRQFAAIYAGSALAIDYTILPFDKGETLRDIRKCMNDAIDLLINNESREPGSAVPHVSDDPLVANFRKRLVKAKFVRAGRYAEREWDLTVQEIEAAEGFIRFDEPDKVRAMVPTRQLAASYPDKPTRDRLVALLRQQKIFGAGRQADTSARQTMVSPFPKKIPCYWVSLKALGLDWEELQVR